MIVFRSAIAMPVTQSRGDYHKFHDTLAKLERLVDLRDSLSESGHATTTMRAGIIYTQKLLADFDVNTSESSAIEELGRLAKLRMKIERQSHDLPPYSQDGFRDRHILDTLIDGKIDSIQIGLFSQDNSKDDVARMATLERLIEVHKFLDSKRIDILLSVKINEVVYYRKAKVSLGNDPLLRCRYD